VLFCFGKRDFISKFREYVSETRISIIRLAIVPTTVAVNLRQMLNVEM